MADARPELTPLPYDARQCWVCFGTDIENPGQSDQWVAPCRCRGSTRWVHQDCVRHWVAEKQRGELTVSVHCQQCQTAYIIQLPNVGPLLVVIDRADQLITKAAPVGLAAIVGMTLYWNFFSYGAVTMYAVLGSRELSDLFDKLDPIATVVGLPLIPCGLMVLNAIPLVDKMVKFYFNTLRPMIGNVPILCWLPQAEPLKPEVRSNDTSLPALARKACGALAFPYIAAFVGHFVFKSVSLNWKKAALGGILYFIMKTNIKFYLKVNQYARLGQRIIANHPENNM